MVELVIGVHFLIVLFFILGFPIGLFCNFRLFRIIHASMLAATIWEKTLRQSPVYEGSFLAAWLNKILYMEGFDPTHVMIMDFAFTVLVISSFYWRPTTIRRGTNEQ